LQLAVAYSLELKFASARRMLLSRQICELKSETPEWGAPKVVRNGAVYVLYVELSRSNAFLLIMHQMSRTCNHSSVISSMATTCLIESLMISIMIDL
jgi:hypothetical protein